MKRILAGVLVLLAMNASAERQTQDGHAEETPSFVRLIQNEAYDEALPLVRRAAEAGEPEGLFYLARYYAEGWAGVEQDLARAEDLYLKGSGRGCAPCDHQLGRLYDLGADGDMNKSLAMKYYRQAARVGHTESEAFLQALHEAGTRLPVGRKVPDDLTEVPVYLLLPLTPEHVSPATQAAGQKLEGDGTLVLMAERVRLSPKQAEVSLEREQDHIVLSHHPESGHSVWWLPDFAPVEGKEEKELWREVRLEFSLPPGKSFADYKIPISFQTNLAATNVVNLFVYKSGRISLQTATARGDYEHQFHSGAGLDPTVVNLIELFTSSQGNWVLRVNGDVMARGTFDPRYFHNGLSNRVFFEGRIHIHSLALRELLPRKLARRNPEYTIGEISRIELKSASGYLDRYLTELFPESASESRWRFAGADMLYLRREIEFMEMPDKRIVRRPMYILESLVEAKPGEGEPVVFPVQKSLAAGTSEDWMTGEVNKKKVTFRAHLHSIEKSNVHEYSGRLSRIGKD